VSQCVQPTVFTLTSAIRWGAVSAMTFVSGFALNALAALYLDCQNYYIENPTKYPLTIENWFKPWTDDNPDLVFCFPFSTGLMWRFPIWQYDLYAELDGACGASGCVCPGYYSNIFSAQGNGFGFLLNSTLELLVNGLKVFGYFFGLPFRLTNTSQFWEAIWWRMQGIWPAWVLDLFGSQGEPGSEAVLFMCAATKGFGPFLTIWFLILFFWLIWISFGLFVFCTCVLGMEYLIFLLVLGIFYPARNTIERRTRRKQNVLALYKRFLRRPRRNILYKEPVLG
jgi:hypothetical protein